VDTIAAIASPPGPGARGIVRVSGARARELTDAAVRFDDARALSRRGAWSGRFDDGRGTQPVDVLWMPAPRSYTCEDVAEFHLPGSPPLLAAALARLVELGARPAQAGEFTRRAFENGRIDLTRAEGVLALIESATEGERRAALQLLAGDLEQRVAALREAVLGLRALCEASLDFDEADTGHVPAAELLELGARARAGFDEALAFEARRGRSGGAPRIVLAGAPNAGKSTLFNALTGARALVSDEPGTTRDTLRGFWSVHGVACDLIDTAGLCDDLAAPATAEPERAAQSRARAELAGADVVLHLVEVRGDALELDEALRAVPRIVVHSKSDLAPELARRERRDEDVWLSALDGTGIDQLTARVAAALGLAGRNTAAPGHARELSERHVACLHTARARLDEALGLLSGGAPLDLAAEALRAAGDALDELDGHNQPEAVLDRVFERFCIGK
jgi:tRNA modification GTPase